MFIIFDTNVLVKELALSSISGSAVRFYIRENAATVVVPEVVQLELRENLSRRLREFAQGIRDNHRQLLAVFGTLRQVVLPSDDEIVAKVNEIVAGLDVPTRVLPLSLDAARSSFLKTINKTPPSERAQEFKDGVIWAHCLELLPEDDVYLVTADKAFFEGRSYDNGLATALVNEVAGFSHEVRLFPDLSRLLVTIRRDVDIDAGALVQALLTEHAQRVNSMLENHGFSLEPDPDVEVSLFATENAKILYFEFGVTFMCSDVRGEGRAGATLRLEGQGSYDTETSEFGSLRLNREELAYTDDEGGHEAKSASLFVEGAIAGHASVRHEVREPLR